MDILSLVIQMFKINLRASGLDFQSMVIQMYNSDLKNLCGFMDLYGVEYTIHSIYSHDSVQRCTYSGSI